MPRRRSSSSSSSPPSKRGGGTASTASSSSDRDDDDASLSPAARLALDDAWSAREAEAVSSSAGWASGRVESFNLSSVVTNPRGGPSLPPSLSSPSAATSPDGTTTKTRAVADAVNSLTHALDAFSRDVFGEGVLSSTHQHDGSSFSSSRHGGGPAMEEYEGWDDVDVGDGGGAEDAAAVEELLGARPAPRRLRNSDFSETETWLRRCGRAANALEQRRRRAAGDAAARAVRQRADGTYAAARPRVSTSTEGDVPDAFFSAVLDLSDPDTFEALLLRNDDADADAAAAPTSSSSLSAPAMAERQETLAAHLDAVEMELLRQVRARSHEFFRETDNFNYLKTTIGASVDQVRALRRDLGRIKADAVDAAARVPRNALRRDCLRDLDALLQRVQDVAQAKASVAGLIEAGDWAGVVDAFAAARDVLERPPDDNDGGPPLSRLAAFSALGDQFDVYEKIVVENLGTALVERFLGWSTAATATVRDVDDENGDAATLASALARLNRLDDAKELYAKRLSEMVKVTVRTTVTECAADAVATATTDANHHKNSSGSVTSGVTGMTFPQFLNCLDMLFEQLLGVLRGAVRVHAFWREHGTTTNTTTTTTNNNNNNSALHAATELAHKSISELLRLRKDAHSVMLSLDEMKSLWDTCLAFTIQLEKCVNGAKAYGLRSTLLAQAKAFLERRHESAMAGLAAALDREKWVQCDVSADRQAALTRLCSGRAVLSTNSGHGHHSNHSSKGGDGDGDEGETKETEDAAPSQPPTPQQPQQPPPLKEAYVDDVPHKVVWSCLLLLEHLLLHVSAAAHFQTLAAGCVSRVAELLRLFNSRTSQLVLGAGAVHSSAGLRSINARHLALVTQCLGLCARILPHVRAALMAQLPGPRRGLLHDLDKIKREYDDHSERVDAKFVDIVAGIVEHGLAGRIGRTDFDERARRRRPTTTSNDDDAATCPFLDGVDANARKLHQVLVALLPPEHLRDVFSRIFARLDQMIPSLFVAAAARERTPPPTDKAAKKKTGPVFRFPTTEAGKRRMIAEVETLAGTLNSLPGVEPWRFSAPSVLETRLDYRLRPRPETEEPTNNEEETTTRTNGGTSADDAPNNAHANETDAEESPSATENATVSSSAEE